MLQSQYEIIGLGLPGLRNKVITDQADPRRNTELLDVFWGI